MFRIGDTVIYGTQGVCRISDITEMKFAGEIHKYYVLISTNDNKSTAYVPVDNEKLVGKMKSVLSPEQINELIDSIADAKDEWIDDDAIRKEYCIAAIKSGNMHELIKIITMLYKHKKQLVEVKKSLHSADERVLREAEKLLNNEIAYSLEINACDVAKYIQKRINSQRTYSEK